MKNIVAALAIAIVAAGISVSASDRTGVYAVVDKVVFEPSADNPERIQVWGAFAIASRKDNDAYAAVERGYLYFVAADSNDQARKEWNDLKALAGGKKIAGFSSRFGQVVRVRAASEKPQSPDRYAMGIGVQAIQADRDYAPIKALAAQMSR
jgi:hypothetical protein